MTRIRTAIALALAGTFLWKLVRRRRTTHPDYAPSYEAPYVMERRPDRKAPLRSDAAGALADTVRAGAGAGAKAVRLGADGATMLARRLRELRATTAGPELPEVPADIDEGTVQFEWSVRTSDPTAVAAALEAAGISFAKLDVSPDAREEGMAERLMAVGIHLDQEPSGDFVAGAVARYEGTASPRRLTDAFERVLRSAHTGFVVDASEAAPVLIDEHQDVGTGVLALLEPTDARLTHGEQGRAFLRAMRAAGERQQRQQQSL